MSAISVIIPMHNAEDRIEDTVAQVLQQNFDDYEILLIDDGSTDRTAQVCEGLCRRDPRIRLISKPNGGVSSARNTGLDHASGEYIAFVDDDDMLSADYLRKLYSAAVEYDLDWVYCKYKRVEWDEKAQKYKRYRGFSVFPDTEIITDVSEIGRVREAVLNGPGLENLFSNCMSLYRREIIEREHIRLNTDITYGEDTLFNYRIAGRIKRFGYINEPLYYYMLRAESSSRGLDPEVFLREWTIFLQELNRSRIDQKIDWDKFMARYFTTRIYQLYITAVAKIDSYTERKQYYGELDRVLQDELGDMWALTKETRLRFREQKIAHALLKNRHYEMVRVWWRFRDSMLILLDKF